MNSTINVQWFTGEKKLEPIKYIIKCNKTKRLWWFDKKEYFIHTDFAAWGPFRSYEEVLDMLEAGQVKWNEIETDVSCYE